MVDVPDVYQDILEAINQALAKIAERYKRATKLDAYMYRIQVLDRIFTRLWDMEPPRYRIWSSAFMNSRPVPEDFGTFYATQPVYESPPKIPGLDATFSRWENLALAPVRWFAKPAGDTCIDMLATIVAEAGFKRHGLIVPVGPVGEGGYTGQYRFCDSNDCFDVEYIQGQNPNEPGAYFDFSGKGVKVTATPRTDEVVEECDFDTWEGKAKLFAKLLAFRNLIIAKSAYYTAKEAITNIFEEGQNPIAVLGQVPKEFANDILATACRKLTESPKDTFTVRGVWTENWTCEDLGRRPYVIVVETEEQGTIRISGMNGYQYWYTP